MQGFCIVIVSIIGLIFFSSYTTVFIDELSSVTPSLLTSNRRLKPKALLSDGDKSPLFNSFKTRYYQFFPRQRTQSSENSIGSIDHFPGNKTEEDEKDYLFFESMVQNNTFNHLFERPGDPDGLYLLNSNNEYYTENIANPYYSEINLLRVNIKPYFKEERRWIGTQFKDGRHLKENTVVEDKHWALCYKAYVPGVITHVQMSPSNREALVAYRMLRA